jgi:hypothetical protein
MVFRAPELGARFPRGFRGCHPGPDQILGAKFDV